MTFRHYLFTFWFTAASLSLFAQNDSTVLSSAVKSLQSYSEKNPVEKVYLHLDKPYYAAGDDIWFKAYVTVGSRHELSGISGVLNVELIDNKGSIKQYIKLPLVSGLTWGDFKLPDTLNAGNYRIRAYTRWMRNAGPEYFYDRTVRIGNAVFSSAPVIDDHKRKQAQQIASAVNSEQGSIKTSVQFFPEGGSLVYGIKSTVAFKAVGGDGFGKDIKGVIVDEQNRPITTFSSRHLGMGAFDLLPVTGETYKARISYPDGSENSIDLPVPLTRGYVLHVNNTVPLNIEVTIEASRDLIKENANRGINLIAQSGNDVYYAANSRSASSSFTAIIPKNKFPSGVVQFTLFSSDGEPLNERLVFIQNADQLNISAAASGKVFTPGGKMKIDLDVKSDLGQPDPGNFSVAVIDETKVPAGDADECTIFSNLLLTSDLRGYVENPGYYFTTVNAQTTADLDLVMLTQGYRRFEWKQILANNPAPVVYQPERSLEITGCLKTLSDKPVPHGKVSLLSSGNSAFLLDTITDNQGYFAFKNLQFKDGVKFIVQCKSGKNKNNVKLELDSMGSAPLPADKNLAGEKDSIDTNFTFYLANSKLMYNEQGKYGIGNHVIALKEVKINEKKTLLNSSNLMGAGDADQVLLMKDVRGAYSSIASALQGKLIFVNVSIDMFGVGTFYSRNGKMVIYVDGVPSSPELLNSMPPEAVESVEVLTTLSKTSIYGSEAKGGVLLINTKKGGFSEASATNIIAYMPKGYYKAREFYVPRYDDPKTNMRRADLRSTIYWNPNIATDKNGKASFEYFNNDNKGSFRVVVEGIDGNGNLGRRVYRYIVE